MDFPMLENSNQDKKAVGVKAVIRFLSALLIIGCSLFIPQTSSSF
jgi:hypothetical protein